MFASFIVRVQVFTCKLLWWTGSVADSESYPFFNPVVFELYLFLLDFGFVHARIGTWIRIQNL
jgi:hypothetical protein